MIFDVVTLTLKFDLLYKTIDGDYDFWITGVIYCCYLHMVAAGELCCLSDNSGYMIDMPFDPCRSGLYMIDQSFDPCRSGLYMIDMRFDPCSSGLYTIYMSFDPCRSGLYRIDMSFNPYLHVVWPL